MRARQAAHQRTARSWVSVALPLAAALGGCAPETPRLERARAPSAPAADASPAPARAEFVLSAHDPRAPLRWIVYGDMRFTALSEREASWPGPRQALVARIASEQPFALFLTGDVPWHGGSPNEAALAAQVTAAASAHHSVRFVVCAAHVHNYERFERDGVLFLVSGGGGAKPTPLQHSAQALYRGDAFPNFHYLRFELRQGKLYGEMIRLADPDAPAPRRWSVQDHFTVD